MNNEIIENTGSIARDHLANERTFIAWLRTGVTLMGVGIALVKFDAIISGIFLTVVGISFVIMSIFRYFEVLRALKEDKFIINSNCIILITISSIILVLISFGVLFIQEYR